MSSSFLGISTVILAIWASVIVLGILVVALFFVKRLIKSEKIMEGLLPSEMLYWDPKRQVQLAFPTPFSRDVELVHLSVIVPAYKEEDRLPLALDDMIPHLKAKEKEDPKMTWEIIIVDDGSTDKTCEVALTYVNKEGVDHVRLLKLEKNRGKGGAVKRGMFVSRGKYMLMADADGATKFRDIDNLEARLQSIEKDGFGIAVGSRAHLEDQDVVRQRSLLRNLLMWGFHFLVAVVGGITGIRDTQCGFKVFSRDAAKSLFTNLHVERWCFDVELLFLAYKFRIPVTEVAVNWHEVDGSKLDTFWTTFQMLRDLMRIRLNYTLGVWNAKK